MPKYSLFKDAISPERIEFIRKRHSRGAYILSYVIVFIVTSDPKEASDLVNGSELDMLKQLAKAVSGVNEVLSHPPSLVLVYNKQNPAMFTDKEKLDTMRKVTLNLDFSDSVRHYLNATKTLKVACFNPSTFVFFPQSQSRSIQAHMKK